MMQNMKHVSTITCFSIGKSVISQRPEGPKLKTHGPIHVWIVKTYLPTLDLGPLRRTQAVHPVKTNEYPLEN